MTFLTMSHAFQRLLAAGYAPLVISKIPGPSELGLYLQSIGRLIWLGTSKTEIFLDLRLLFKVGQARESAGRGRLGRA